MPYLPFFHTTNLTNPSLDEGQPWDFSPANLEEVRALPKDRRNRFMMDAKTNWNIYTAIRATASNQRVSRENPPAGLRGLVADYDMKTSIPEVVKYLNQIAPAFVPNFIEVSLSKRIRLVWVFEREVLIPNSRFCNVLVSSFFDLIGIRTLLAGFDDKSEEAEMVWTNGGEWHTANPEPMKWETIFGILAKTSKKSEFGKSDVPLELVYDKIRQEYPGRWKGDFQLNAIGLRFWDERADNMSGCQVKPDGMLCFTGSVPFMKWEALFGASWVNDQKTVNLGRIAGDIYYDGFNYWELKNSRWYASDRCDILLRLKTRGISGAIKSGTGETASEAEKILDHIQNVNRIEGAAPLLCQRPGLVDMDGSRILNISTVRALEPHSYPATPEAFPWIWKFIHGLFDRPEENAVEYFLAWLQRSYAAFYYYRRSMGQAVFLCGPKENGKSLLCYKIIKPLLGNKIANPFDYFMGLTTFNAELFEAALLAINDEEAPSNEQARAKFLSRIKNFVVNPSCTYHQKFCKPFTVERTSRLFITLNDDPASVGLLPEVSGNTEDKLMFFGSRPYQGEWEPSHVLEPRIEKELPYFARWLLDWTPPTYLLLPGRMGVKSYFDERILTLSRQQMFAYALLEIFAIWIQTSGAWAQDIATVEVTPGELHSQLGNCETLRANMKDWNSHKVQRALRTLAQLSATGVELVPDSGERLYKLTRSMLAKKENKPTA